jgi:hypothetical protein
MGSTSEYPDLISAKLHIGRFIDDVYCTKRIHSSLGYLAPAEFAAQRPKLSLRLTLSNKIFVSSFTGPLQRRSTLPPPSRPLRVFLCHSSRDKFIARDLYERLSKDGFNPWLDEESLVPGQNWLEEIPKAVRTSDVVIVCLSGGSINKEGYVNKEIKIALDVADEKPEGAIFVIPLKFEDCKVPDRLSRWHWVNFFGDEREKAYGRLMRALHSRAESLGLGGAANPEAAPSPENSPPNFNRPIRNQATMVPPAHSEPAVISQGGPASKTPLKPSAPLWIQIFALISTTGLIAFLIVAYFMTPNMTDDQRDLARFLTALLAGFAASFIGGAVLLRVDLHQTRAVKLALSATSGLAIFVFFYIYQPDWRKGENFPPPPSTPSLSPSPTRTPTDSGAPHPRAKPKDEPVNRPDGQQPANSPTAEPPVIQKSGRVLLMVEDQAIVQALTQKMAGYGLIVAPESEIGKSALAKVREALQKLLGGDRDAGNSISFAVVVKGKISAVPRSSSQDESYVVADTSGGLEAVVTSSGYRFSWVPETHSAGRTQEEAIQNVLSYVRKNIDGSFIKEIASMAR